MKEKIGLTERMGSPAHWISPKTLLKALYDSWQFSLIEVQAKLKTIPDAHLIPCYTLRFEVAKTISFHMDCQPLLHRGEGGLAFQR